MKKFSAGVIPSIAFVITGSILLTSSPAHAFDMNPVSNFVASSAHSQPLVTGENVEKFESELEEFFTEVVYETESGWDVDYTKADKFNLKSSELVEIRNFLNALYEAPESTLERLHRESSPRLVSPQYQVGSDEYVRCVLNATGLGAFVGAAGGGGSQLKYLMVTKNWKEVAWVLARLVGVNALKGGVAGFAVTLAGAGAWCATKWAI
ncbi:hypothetical protein [Streptococcus hyovaginalis]|uniref:hypothetical protein n=1 Tax=Streptococcus hyovaginalis TaxID=149015 RepID=UPI003B3A9BE3